MQPLNNLSVIVVIPNIRDKLKSDILKYFLEHLIKVYRLKSNYGVPGSPVNQTLTTISSSESTSTPHSRESTATERISSQLTE